MGFFSDDMVPMLGVYQAETSELMGALGAIVSRVEQEDKFEQEDVAELFRCAHTIKGSSAMMGLDALSTYTHRVEDLFDLLRTNPSLAEGNVGSILDYLYSFSDYVQDEISRMENPDYAPADADDLIAEVSSYVEELATGGSSTPAAKAVQAEAEQEAPPKPEASTEDAPAPTEDDGAILKVAFKPDVPMVNARALVILRQLGSQVGVRSHIPEDLTNAQAAEVIVKDGLLVVVDPDGAEKARQILAKNSFVRHIDVLDAAVNKPAIATPKQDGRNDGSSPAADKFVTLRWDNVHELQDLVGEFLLHVSHLRSVFGSMPEENGVRSAVSQTARLVDELSYQVNKMAMVSMSAMVPQLSRMVRDMCRNSGKRVSFEVHGGNIEIDRNLYNSIADPLLHIIRNAVDHGIESPEQRLAAGKDARGKVTLSIENLGARVAFRVSDDGKGINTTKVLAKAEASGMLEKPASSYTRTEVLHMVMLAGLSTSNKVTQYSGRGVGMDVVNAVVRDFNGSVDIESEAGKGTSMTLFMPVSVTSVECLCFRIGHALYHVPLFNLNKVYTAAEAANHLSLFEGSALFEYDKRQVPVLDMHRLLGCDGSNAFYIVCHSLDDEFVIGVDDVLGDSSSANKPLPSCLGPSWQEVCPIRNVAIMDDGAVGYVLNSPLLADFAQGRRQMPAAVAPHESALEPTSIPREDAPGELPSNVFVFTLGDVWYALPVEQVERLSPMPTCSRTPRGLPHLMGLTSYRNRPVAVFDLAGSAGVEGDCPYMLIVQDERGENVGLAISSAIGVRSLDDAVPAEEQPERRAFVCGLYTTVAVKADLREPVITLLARV